MSKSDVATRSTVVERFLAAVKGTEDRDPEVTAMQLVEQILQANTVEEVFAQADAQHPRDWIDTPFTLRGIKFNESTMEGDGPDFYGVLDCVDDDGLAFPMTCGAVKVMARAWRAQDLDVLPARVVLRQSKTPTANGFKVMDLELIPSL